MKTNFLESLSLFLMVLGSLNWALTIWTDFNLVTKAFGWLSFGPTLIYSIVGLAGIYGIWMFIQSLLD